MRMRKKKNRDSRFQACSHLHIAQPELNKGKWNEVFGNENKIRLEIGCGKGDFITALAQREPDVNFIAIEKCMDVIILAMEKVQRAEIKNVRFMWADAENLLEVFEENEIDTIYLNFSDPWKKAKQAKRRLTYRTFLAIYNKILKPEGYVEFKTDNRPLFDFSLEEFELYGAEIDQLTFDLHNSEYNEGNIQTEYERNFSAKGFPINRCRVSFNN